jgi:hypothetical protein
MSVRTYMNLKEVLEHDGLLSMHREYEGLYTEERGKDKWSHHLYTCTITIDHVVQVAKHVWKIGNPDMRSADFQFKMGTAHNNEPELADVLYCLLLDAGAMDETFESWCGNFGYDSDSRAAEKVWKACRQNGKRLLNLIGRVYFEDLRSREH